MMAGELEPRPSREVVIPTTGELVSLDDPAAVAVALNDVKRTEWKLRELRYVLSDALVEESRRQGSKTLRLDGLTARISGGPETTYDVTVLVELLAAGLPEERYSEIVVEQIEYKVKAAELKRLAAANAVYAEIIERARQTVEKPYRASV